MSSEGGAPPEQLDPSSEAVVRTATRFFHVGFALLPWVWAINVLYLLPFIRERGDPAMKKTVRSSIGALAWAAVLAAWMSVYYTQRSSWGIAGDKISVNIPSGY